MSETLPEIAQAAQHPMMQNATLRQIQGYQPALSKELLTALDEKLQKIKN